MSLRGCFLVMLMTLGVTAASAAEPIRVDLYPDGPAESNGIAAQETYRGIGLINVSDARMEIFLPQSNPTGQTVVICPGGGYFQLTMKSEGYDVADWLNSRGIAAAVLTYRLPNGHRNVPLTDALTAVAYIRSHAAELGVSPSGIGILGFSAGGHLASTALTKYTGSENRPDFGILFYPVITMTAATHSGSRDNLLGRNAPQSLIDEFSSERNVTADTPVTFLALCSDDRTVPVTNSLSFYEALVRNGVRGCEMHIYPSGGHGWGFTYGMPYLSEMLTSLERWLREVSAAE